MRDIVYATTNPGKFREVSKLFAGYGITIHAPSEYDVSLEVEETGSTLEENAILKAESYLDSIDSDVIVIGDDTGLEIDALGGEPGIKVRRWKGYKMSDEEIIDYTLERLKDIPKNKRQAQFRTVIAVAMKEHVTQVFSGILKGFIVENPHDYREEGVPFQPLFYSTEYKRMLYEFKNLSLQEKIDLHINTHRERAVTASLPYLSTLMN